MPGIFFPEKKGAQNIHDLGPWPVEMKPTLHEPNEAGLMYDGDLSRVTTWLRRADWNKANEIGKSYE